MDMLWLAENMTQQQEDAQQTLQAMTEGYNPFPDPKHLNPSGIAFLTCMYAYVLFMASNLISDGSELLLLVPSMAGLVGSIVLPILGAVPDGMMVLFSGMGPRDEAQEKVSVGVGALSGSTVMLLTLPWFLAVLAGRVNIVRSPDGDDLCTYKRPANADPKTWEKLSPPGNCSPFHTGISFLPELKHNAKLMLLTSISYLIIQVPAFLHDTDKDGMSDTDIKNAIHTEARQESIFALIGIIVCFLLFCYYLYIMWAESRSGEGETADKIAATNVNAIKNGQLTLRGAMANFRDRNWNSMVTERDDLEAVLLNKRSMDEVRRMCKVLAPFFSNYDLDGNGTIDFDEFRMVFRDVNENLSKDGQKAMFDAADTDRSGCISFEEFVACMMSFALDNSNDLKDDDDQKQRKYVTVPQKYLDDGQSAEVGEAEDNDDEDAEEEEDVPEDLAGLSPEEQQVRIKRRAFWMMGLGTALVLVFSDPMVDLLAEIGVRTNISPFYISFVIAPIASNASELVAALNYAKKKTTKSMHTALSTLLGAGIMNNTFCLGIFLALVYGKGLAWEFKAETVSILVIELAMGITVLMRPGQKLIECGLVLSLYPMSLGIVAFLENILLWD